MRAPARERLPLILDRPWAFAQDSRLGQVRITVGIEERFSAERRQRLFSAIISLPFQCFLRLLEVAHRDVLGIRQHEPPRGLATVATVDPELAVEPPVALMEGRHATIARVTYGSKLAAMIYRGSQRLRKGIGRSRHCNVFQDRTLAQSLAQAMKSYTYLFISSCKSTMPGWRNWQTRQT